MLHITNRTPHAISLLSEDGSVRLIEPIRPPVRIVSETGLEVDKVQGVSLHSPSAFGGLSGLPDRRHATVVVVSQLAAMAVAAIHPDRDDVFYPDTSPSGGAWRDNGRVLAVKRLLRAT